DTLVTTDGRLAIDPYSKVVNKVESGQLTVDGEVVDIPSPRWQAAMTAWQNNDRKAVEELGIGVVVEGEEILYETAASTPKVPWILTSRSEEHTSELQSRFDIVCRLLLA